MAAITNPNPLWRRGRWLALLLLAGVLSACSGSRVGSSSWPGLTLSDTTAYVAFNQSVYAVDLASGQERWQFAPPEQDKGATFYAPPALSDSGSLIVTSYSGVVYALKANSGDIIWRRALSSSRLVGGPAVAGDLVLVPSADHNLYALKLDSGADVWSYTTGKPLWSEPLVVGDKVFLSGLDHKLYALDLASGRQLWSTELKGAMTDRPTSMDSLILTGTFANQLVALNADSGRVAWTLQTDGWVWGDPVVQDSVAYFGDVDGTFYAVDSQGHVVWQNHLDGDVTASPAVENGNVYFVTADGQVFARKAADNSPVWQQPLDGQLLTDPAITGDSLLVASLDGKNLLTAFDATSGAVRWTYQPAGK
jgi:outer membrane protein assembly factor BamB